MTTLIGHETVSQQLFAAAHQNRIAHALLFVGPEGVGKKLMARKLVQVMLCPNATERSGCGLCASCLQIEKNQHHSVKWLETEAAHFKIDEAREILKSLSLRQWQGPRFVVFDGADKLNSQAANALLKVIEEPPEDTFFILITNRPQQILPTIRSRTQWIRFSPLSEANLQAVTGQSGWVLASAGGSVQRVMELSESDRSELRVAAIRGLMAIVPSTSYLDVAEILNTNFKEKSDMQILFETWAQLLRDASVLGFRPSIHADVESEWRSLQSYPFWQLDEMFKVVSQMKDDLEANVDRQLLLESGILKLQRCLNQKEEMSHATRPSVD